MRRHQNESLRNFANIFDFANLRKPIRNHIYSMQSIQAMYIYDKLHKAMKFIKINERSIEIIKKIIKIQWKGNGNH